MRILVVDDSAELLELLSIVLRACHHTVYSAANALEGLAHARRERPDLILADVEMPGIDGLEFLRQVRMDSRLVGCPVVALTACAMSGDRERLLLAGFTGYISKPIRPRELGDQIAQYACAWKVADDPRGSQ